MDRWTPNIACSTSKRRMRRQVTSGRGSDQTERGFQSSGGQGARSPSGEDVVGAPTPSPWSHETLPLQIISCAISHFFGTPITPSPPPLPFPAPRLYPRPHNSFLAFSPLNRCPANPTPQAQASRTRQDCPFTPPCQAASTSLPTPGNLQTLHLHV
jgi:hypothetical protein